MRPTGDVPPQAMAPVDAQFYLTPVPNDQFLLYAFDGSVDDIASVLDALRRRAAACADLTARVEDHSYWRYPKWVAAQVDKADLHHRVLDAPWQDCLAAVAQLADHQLDCQVLPWRLHVFTRVDGVPMCRGDATVAVLQVAHALADGTRAAALAGWLFGRAGAPPAPPTPLGGWFASRVVAAARAQRTLAHDTAQGLVPAPGPSRVPTVTNELPPGPRVVRTIALRRDELPGPSVTVAVLAAVGAALAEHFESAPVDLGAEVPMAKAGKPHARNHFRNVSVGLYPDLPWALRCERIAADLAARRRRAEHPAVRADELGFAATPAALLRWGMSKFDAEARSPMVSGHTVVSSVNRGCADLRFGSAPVALTAGYPALSPMMGLVHGVHGIGDTIALSVHAAQAVVGDVDAYVQRLRSAIG